MTPAFAWALAVAFTLVLWLGAVVLEETAWGRSVADQLIDRITRTRR